MMPFGLGNPFDLKGKILTKHISDIRKPRAEVVANPACNFLEWLSSEAAPSKSKQGMTPPCRFLSNQGKLDEARTVMEKATWES